MIHRGGDGGKGCAVAALVGAIDGAGGGAPGDGHLQVGPTRQPVPGKIQARGGRGCMESQPLREANRENEKQNKIKGECV